MFDRWAFNWIEPIISLSHTRDLNYNDLLTPPHSMQSQVLRVEFQNLWNQEKDKKQTYFPTLWKVLHQIIFYDFWYGGLCRLVSDILVLIGPVLIEFVVNAAQSGNFRLVFVYATLILATSVVQVSCV